MGIFGKRARSDPAAQKKAPIGPIDDGQIRRAGQLMAAFNRAVGDDAALRAVSSEIFAAVGITRFEDFVRRSIDTDIGWRWLAAVSSAAASRGDKRLPSEIFAFTTFWTDYIAPLLGPGDWIDLCLDKPSPEVQAQTAASALSCLLTFASDEAIMDNSTGQLTAGGLAGYAAQKILDLDGADSSITPQVLSIAHRVIGAP